MKFASPLIKATLLKRYKRFLADVQLDDGTTLTVHCANPGSMAGLKTPGATIYLSDSNNPKRKLRYSWELIEVGDTLVGVNTMLPNKIVEEALHAQTIAELSRYHSLRREVKYGTNSRIDFLLSDPALPDCYVEVKNVHFSRTATLAEFPDSITARGAKHLDELAKMVAEGHRAVMLYLVQRDDCTCFRLASDLDPTYAAAYERATKAGVEAYAYDCTISQTNIALQSALPFV